MMDLNNVKNNKLDAWGDHVEEYSKRQKQLHQELVNRKLMEHELKNTTSEKTNMTKNDNTIQTQPDLIWFERKPNNITWTQIKLWSMSVLAVIAFLGCVYLMLINKTALFVFGITVGVSAIIGLVVGIKGLIEGACEEIKMSRK